MGTFYDWSEFEGTIRRVNRYLAEVTDPCWSDRILGNTADNQIPWSGEPSCPLGCDGYDDPGSGHTCTWPECGEEI